MTNISNKEGFVIVVSGWITSCVIGAMPYVLWGGEFSLTNAWFESVSGFTTTGSSILTDVEILPAGLLFWRAATHWIGGIGIIVFVLAVLPSSGNIGMVLYRSEASSLSMENFNYRTKKSVQILAVVYVGLTLAHIVALLLCGMNLFDAVTHAFASIATGGFSTKNLSIAHFHSLSVEMVVMAFMLISGIHFGLLFSVSQGKVMDFYKNPILRYYLAAMTTGILLVAVNLHLRSGYDWGHAFRAAGFPGDHHWNLHRVRHGRLFQMAILFPTGSDFLHPSGRLRRFNLRGNKSGSLYHFLEGFFQKGTDRHAPQGGCGA